MNKNKKLELLESLKKLTKKNLKSQKSICVLGDLILDEYLLTSPERVSREAPVLILEYKKSNYNLGGASNAASNIASFGAKVVLCGALGGEKNSLTTNQIFKELCQKQRINLLSLLLEQRQTTLKTRIVSINQALASQAGRGILQQILRIDRQTKVRFNLSEKEELNKFIFDLKSSLISEVDLFLVSDYSLGVINTELISRLKKLKKKIIVDPIQNFSKFRDCFLLTPNQPDTEKEIDFKIETLTNLSLKKIFKSLKKQCGSKTNYLITLGSRGMILFESKNSRAYVIPVFNQAEVFDVTGAGDTVSGCLSYFISQEFDLLDACLLANLSGGIVVKKPGVQTTSLDELEEELSRLDPGVFTQIKSFDLL